MTLRVEGIDDVRRKLRALESNKARQIVAESIANDLMAATAPYPPESEANRPSGRYSWYVRGFGTRTRTGKAYATSEDLINRWKVRRKARGAILENTASYAGYVHDEKRQARWHKRRAWQVWQEQLKQNGDKWAKNAGRALERLVDRS